jgi:NTE family protein
MKATAGRRVGLALGGGGARGWAHIGVINAVRDAGLDVHCVAGTSMGALVGAAFASGKLDALHQVALDLEWRRVLHYFFELSLPRTGLIDGSRIVEFVREHVLPTEISELPVPFAAVATDVLTGEEVVIREGPVTDAVRASVAIPGMFTPFVREDHVLVDGGLVNPLPVSVARSLGAEFVIAVDITREPQPAHASRQTAGEPLTGQAEFVRNERTRRVLNKLNIKLRGADSATLPASRKSSRKDAVPNIFEIYGNSMRIVQRQITEMRLKLERPDVLIQPGIQDISTMEFHRAADAIRAGHEAARTALEALGT